MLKNILVIIYETSSSIAVISGIALSIIGMLKLGTWPLILIGICSLVLSIGVFITLKMMDKKRIDDE